MSSMTAATRPRRLEDKTAVIFGAGGEVGGAATGVPKQKMAEIITSGPVLRRSPTLAETPRLVSFRGLGGGEHPHRSDHQLVERSGAGLTMTTEGGVIAEKDDLAPPHCLRAQALSLCFHPGTW
jgi:hypothetical protein